MISRGTIAIHRLTTACYMEIQGRFRPVSGSDRGAASETSHFRVATGHSGEESAPQVWGYLTDPLLSSDHRCANAPGAQFYCATYRKTRNSIWGNLNASMGLSDYHAVSRGAHPSHECLCRRDFLQREKRIATHAIAKVTAPQGFLERRNRGSGLRTQPSDAWPLASRLLW